MVKIKKAKRTGGVTKFKIRTNKYLYTLCINDAEKVEKLKQSLPPGIFTYLLTFSFGKEGIVKVLGAK